ncbi:hypothetical protein POL68_19365 [Stigmatella sp. ncwal1]|uniref:Lipoprotein n=1 Tax=Stigmatella ashevillensis TaxID=2995309 RepID=A0ABT5DAM2_9BACT|nr:hypothetical protein [Stigmatella ashevillena]MDC0710644.1 hypothetical protein [Stigmatella ashevillena]
MRITSLMVVLVAGLTLAGTGCGNAQPVSTDEQVSTQGVSEQTGSEQSSSALVGPCPLKWTCDYSAYYATKAACTTACGTNTCYRDYACNGTCICP